MLAAVLHEPATALHVLYVNGGDDPIDEALAAALSPLKNFASCEVLHEIRFTEPCAGASFAGDGTLRARSTRSRVGGLDPRKSWRQVESSFPAPSIREKI